MNFSEWIGTITADNNGKIAENIGISRRTLQYQLSNGEKIDTIIDIAQHYGENPITALVNLGHVEKHWLNELAGNPEAALMAATEDQLAGEVLRRLKEAKWKTALDTPINELDDELAARRNWQDLAVADSSPDEEEGDPGDYDA